MADTANPGTNPTKSIESNTVKCLLVGIRQSTGSTSGAFTVNSTRTNYKTVSHIAKNSDNSTHSETIALLSGQTTKIILTGTANTNQYGNYCHVDLFSFQLS